MATDKLEEPIGLVIAHSDDEAAPTLMGRLSFQQAMYFAMNPGAGESEEDPKAVVGCRSRSPQISTLRGTALR